MSDPIRLEGATALVTGGTSGIGAGIAQALCAAGAHVIITGLQHENGTAVAERLAKYGSVELALLDVRDRTAFADLVGRIERDRGGIDILVNNAGVGFLNTVADSTPEQWDWVLGINLTGVFNGIHAVLPGMLARSGRRAHIVATASIGGMTGASGGVYAAAKFGVVGLIEALRTELRDTPISASVLVPGVIRTNIGHGLQPPGEAPNVPPGGLTPEFLYRAPMTPDEVGQRVVQGILRDDLHIFTHTEHEPILRQRFDAILRAIPYDPDVDPQRVEVETAILTNPLYDELPPGPGR